MMFMAYLWIISWIQTVRTWPNLVPNGLIFRYEFEWLIFGTKTAENFSLGVQLKRTADKSLAGQSFEGKNQFHQMHLHDSALD